MQSSTEVQRQQQLFASGYNMDSQAIYNSERSEDHAISSPVPFSSGANSYVQNPTNFLGYAMEEYPIQGTPMRPEAVNQAMLFDAHNQSSNAGSPEIMSPMFQSTFNFSELPEPPQVQWLAQESQQFVMPQPNSLNFGFGLGHQTSSFGTAPQSPSFVYSPSKPSTEKNISQGSFPSPIMNMVDSGHKSNQLAMTGDI